MKLWSKHKSPSVKNEDFEELHLEESDEKGDLIWEGNIQEFFKEVVGGRRRECPHEEKCICFDCSRKGKCYPEKLCREEGCAGYIVTCTVKSDESGGPTLGKQVSDEWAHHLKKKFGTR